MFKVEQETLVLKKRMDQSIHFSPPVLYPFTVIEMDKTVLETLRKVIYVNIYLWTV